jgi:flagellar hook protein FlgE
VSTTIGPYHAGELPPQLTVTFKDSSGNPINLSGYTAELAYRSYGGAWVTRLGAGAGVAVDADQVNSKGQVHYTWVAADMAIAGDYEGEVWVGNAGTQRFDSVRLAWQVLPAVVPAPTI